MNSEATLSQLKVALPDGQMPSSYGVYFKNTLVALCHALEDHILEQPSEDTAAPLVLVTFQQGKWYLQEADRYADIARCSERVAIAAVPDSGFGTHATSQLANVDLVNIDNTDSLIEEWNLIILAPGYAAMVLCHERLAEGAGRLIAASCHAETQHHQLCRSEGLAQVMHTDSERLMRAGVAAGVENFAALIGECGWEREEIARTFCHQVGSAHRKMMLSELGLPIDRDYATLDWLGNTGAAALPATRSLGVEQGAVEAGDKIALLGIGSGVNCLMMAVEWLG